MSDEKSYEIESVVGDGVKVTFHLKSALGNRAVISLPKKEARGLSEKIR